MRAVPFASVAVTLGALVRVDLPRGIQVRFRRSKGILQALVFRGDDPGFVLLGHPLNHQNANQKEDRGKEKLTEQERARQVRGHGSRKIFAY